MSLVLRFAFAAGALVAGAAVTTLSAQEEPERPTRRSVVILGVGGGHPRVDGLRLNYRDSDLELVRGVNATIWTPYEPYSGTVKGLALGLPSTGADRIVGLGVGIFGVAGGEELRGISVGGLGVGAGGRVSGLAVGGLGIGSGGGIEAIAIGGLGAGTGGDIRGAVIGGLGAAAGGELRGLAVGTLGVGAGGKATGILVGGLGAGTGGGVHGVAIAGVGVGSGGDMTGLAIGGVGVGSGGDVLGLTVGGVGVGAGGTLRGLTVAGVGIGSGGGIRGLAVAGIGVGAPEIRGGAIAAMVGAERVRGFVIAPALFRTERGGEVRAGTISAVNAVRGEHRGFAIGIVNYARTLDGLQLGVLNIVRDNPRGRRVLPVLNFGRID